jgi:hypothetical protein
LTCRLMSPFPMEVAMMAEAKVFFGKNYVPSFIVWQRLNFLALKEQIHSTGVNAVFFYFSVLRNFLWITRAICHAILEGNISRAILEGNKKLFKTWGKRNMMAHWTIHDDQMVEQREKERCRERRVKRTKS